jgi:hypothetical protein
LAQSLDSPPATLLVLPNGFVKVAAAIGYVCADVRSVSLAQAWKHYRDAWRNEAVIAAISRAISGDEWHAGANTWTSIPNGADEVCAM